MNLIEEYLDQLTEERQIIMNKLRQTILDNIPKGYEEQLSYNMIGYVVPHSIYPQGYHVNSTLPLPFINIASQKNFIAIYHMGLYANDDLLNWFKAEYTKYDKRKLNMGKSCIRFTRVNEIPYQLVADLVKRMNVNDWVKVYELKIKK